MYLSSKNPGDELTSLWIGDSIGFGSVTIVLFGVSKWPYNFSKNCRGDEQRCVATGAFKVVVDVTYIDVSEKLLVFVEIIFLVLEFTKQKWTINRIQIGANTRTKTQQFF